MSTFESSSIVTFIIASFAVWRVTSLLNREAGPFAILDYFRQFIGIIDDKGRKVAKNELAELFICPFCLSVWVALPFALILYPFPASLIAWLALSGAAIAIERM